MLLSSEQFHHSSLEHLEMHEAAEGRVCIDCIAENRACRHSAQSFVIYRMYVDNAAFHSKSDVAISVLYLLYFRPQMHSITRCTEDEVQRQIAILVFPLEMSTKRTTFPANQTEQDE